MKLSNDLGRYIRMVRQLKNRLVTQKDIAKRVKISETYYSEIERGVRFPTYKKLMAICAALDIFPAKAEALAKEGLFKRWKGYDNE